MKNVGWYTNRLSKMSVPELFYRVRQKVRERIDKKRFQNIPPVFQVDSAFDSASFFCADAWKDWPGNLYRSFEELANQYVDNKVDIFGLLYDYQEKIDWHLDPKTGKRWPLKFWSEVNIRDGFTIGGPKFVWEVNRLYGLPILGMAYRLSGERKYADKIFALIEDWPRENPYPMGVNWTSGIELGTRIANLLWGVSFLEGYDLTAEKKELLDQFVWLHGRHLFRYPSKYSSNNNHAIAEAFALFLIGVYFPGFSEAEKWRAFGKKVLEREVGRQILADGGSYEYTTTYLSFVFDFFLLFKLVCDHNKITYDPIVNKRLEQSCEFIYSLMDKNGNMPNIGDQDSAVLVNLGLDNHQNFQSILNTGAVLYNRPEFRRNNFPDFKTSILLGERIKSECNPKTEHISNKGILLSDSGLVVIRGELAGNEFVFVGNATPLGMPPLYAHGHLDALSFTLTVGGLEIFVDPGTYLYHSGGKWRRYFRSTAAHNTICINGQELTEQVADFMFGKPYRIIEHSLQENDDKVIWRAGHDAYHKLKIPVSHARQVVFDRRNGSLEIDDFLSGEGEYLAEQFFHFHPDCSVEVAGSRVRIERGSVKVEMFCDQRLSLELLRGSHDPLLGWYSSAFNHIEESYSLACRAKLVGEVDLRTTLTFRCQV